jgi:AraC family transcriptional activator of pobA
MRVFNDIKSYNEYLGLPLPLDNDIDMGYYNPSTMLLYSEPIRIDFYRVSIKVDFLDNLQRNAKPVTAVYFNSPDLAGGWDIGPNFAGMYLQLSKKIIEENRFLFKNYLDYGRHEPLYLHEDELEEISTVFKLMIRHYESKRGQSGILLSYVNVLVSLVEVFYKRQFAANPKQYSPIITDFQQYLNDYYSQPVKQLPNVQYFADRLGLTANYLGDIVKHFTNKSAIENIHEFVIKKAKQLLEEQTDLNTSEVAFELGFEYPNYFSKFFKKQVNLTPKEYRLQFVSK